MKNILVTGAAGFIGFHLCLKLKNEGFNALGIDNFNDYYDVSLKKYRARILKKANIKIYKIDINESKKIEDLFNQNNFNAVIHLAAQAGVRYSFVEPLKYVNSNLVGFVKLLEIVKKFNTKFIFASSSSVYGLNEKIPFNTTDNTDLPANLYGATKKANESIAFAYYNLYNIPMTCLRFFTVYGPFGRPDMAYFSFTKNILENKPIDLFNYGNMERDFTYIDDIVEGIFASIDKCSNFEIFNLGNSKTVNLKYFVEILEKNLNKKAILNFSALQKGEMIKTFADIEKSKIFLNFNPKTSIEEGLKKFTKWYVDYFSSSLKISGINSKRSEAIIE